MNTTVKIYLSVCLLLLSTASKAQVDPHFSQYFIQPMFLNPALTGAIEGNYRVSGIWRSQYDNSFTTLGVAGEMTTNKNINLGINLINQSSSDKAYNYTNAHLNVAYTGARFNNHHFVMGMQVGVINRRFDINKLQFGEQWTAGVGYDPGTGTAESFHKPSVTSFDAGAGILYYDATPDRKVNLFAGVAAYHITQTRDPFISTGNPDNLPVRYSAHAGTRIILSSVLSFVPNILYMRQGTAEEKMAGAYIQLNAGEHTDLMLGANMRLQDAISPFAGFYHRGLTVGVSYDTNISTKSTMQISRNSFELSMSYTWWNKKSLRTASFFCPRF